jgi:hypothetical protein
MMSKISRLFITAFFLCTAFCSNAQTVQVHADATLWDTAGTGAAFVNHGGRSAISLNSKKLPVKNKQLQNGKIEVDIAIQPGRAFAGLFFRSSNHHYEEVYLRLHKSNQPDALQYTPVFNNESVWQHYPEYQNSYAFKPGSWTHLTIEFTGGNCKVYIDTATKPAINIPFLRTGNTEGSFGLWTQGTAVFSNFSYTPLAETIASTITKNTSPSVITNYQLAEASEIRKEKINIPSIPTGVKWKKVQTEYDGLLNIGKYVTKKRYGMFEENSNDLIWLKMEIPSDKAQSKQLFFEFTNRCWVFVNGQLLYSGDNSFRLRGLSFRGELGKNINSQSLFLPLKKGNNEVLIAVSSVANGWGWMARWAE